MLVVVKENLMIEQEWAFWDYAIIFELGSPWMFKNMKKEYFFLNYSCLINSDSLDLVCAETEPPDSVYWGLRGYLYWGSGTKWSISGLLCVLQGSNRICHWQTQLPPDGNLQLASQWSRIISECSWAAFRLYSLVPRWDLKDGCILCLCHSFLIVSGLLWGGGEMVPA